MKLSLLTSSLATAFLMFGCSGNEPAESSPPPGWVAVEFAATLDPGAGTFDFTTGQTVRGLDPVNVIQDNAAGGPANSIELVSTNISTDPGVCGQPGTFCADVTINSFYGGTLTDVFAEITSIIPATGHEGQNSDAAQQGLSDTLGLWGYGPILGGGNSMRQWVFGNDGHNWTLVGRVMANLCGNGLVEGTVGEECDDGNLVAGDGCSATCTRELFPVDANGMPTQFLVLGPFPNGGNCGVTTTQYINETAASPTFGMTESGFVWTPQNNGCFSGSCGGNAYDLDCHYGPSSSVDSYSFIYVNAPSTRSARLNLHSDDGIAAWVNGVSVHFNNICRGCNSSPDISATFTLNAGQNRLLVKVGEAGGGWVERFDFRDPATGLPMVDLLTTYSP